MATAKITPAPLTRPLSAIAGDITRDYRAKGKPIYYAAEPYVIAMRGMRDFDSYFLNDSAEDVVIRLLGNLSTWRGETATRVRNELKAALAWYQQSRSRGRHPAGRGR